jgi:hypothetical protein
LSFSLTPKVRALLTNIQKKMGALVAWGFMAAIAAYVWSDYSVKTAPANISFSLECRDLEGQWDKPILLPYMTLFAPQVRPSLARTNRI